MSERDEQRLEHLLLVARALPVDQRAAYLDRECADDSKLRRKVGKLVECDECADKDR